MFTNRNFRGNKTNNQAKFLSASPDNPDRLTVTVDFGSSGSRASVVQYGPNFENYQERYRYKLNIPLTVTAGNPDYAQKYAANLFSGIPSAIAATGVPPEAILSVQYGTAGMRTLAPSSQQEIYDVIGKTFSNMTGITNVTIATITGAQEGIYDWFSANYFLPNNKIAVVDFGGVSVEVTYSTQVCDAPGVYAVSLNGTDYCVYTNSQPVGNDQGRIDVSSNPNCFPQGYPSYYTPSNVSCNQTVDTYYVNPSLHALRVGPSSDANQTYLLSTYVHAYCYLVDGQNTCSWTSTDFNLTAYEQGTQQNCQSVWTPEIDPYGATYCFAGYAGTSIYNIFQNVLPHPYVVDKVPTQTGSAVSLSWTIGAGLARWGYATMSNNTTTMPAPILPVCSSTSVSQSANLSINPRVSIAAFMAGGVLAVAFGALAHFAVRRYNKLKTANTTNRVSQFDNTTNANTLYNSALSSAATLFGNATSATKAPLLNNGESSNANRVRFRSDSETKL